MRYLHKCSFVLLTIYNFVKHLGPLCLSLHSQSCEDYGEADEDYMWGARVGCVRLGQGAGQGKSMISMFDLCGDGSQVWNPLKTDIFPTVSLHIIDSPTGPARPGLCAPRLWRHGLWRSLAWQERSGGGAGPRGGPPDRSPVVPCKSRTMVPLGSAKISCCQFFAAWRRCCSWIDPIFSDRTPYWPGWLGWSEKARLCAGRRRLEDPEVIRVEEVKGGLGKGVRGKDRQGGGGGWVHMWRAVSCETRKASSCKWGQGQGASPSEREVERGLVATWERQVETMWGATSRAWWSSRCGWRASRGSSVGSPRRQHAR